MIPIEWMPDVPMERVIFHWTAGTYEPNDHECRAYHFLIDGGGKVHRGVPVERNSGALRSGYAAHTLNANTGSIGVSLCGMGGAQESPYRPGRWPLRQEQFDTLVRLLRDLGERYRIPVERRTMLSHAEVQPVLGIRQRAKWDIAVLPFGAKIRGAVPVGDTIRAMVSEAEEPARAADLPMPAGAIARVTSKDNLNTRRQPDGEVVGSLPPGTMVEVIRHSGDWVDIRSPAGFRGWVHGAFLEAEEGPPVAAPTIPDPRRQLIAEIRDHCDAALVRCAELEAIL